MKVKHVFNIACLSFAVALAAAARDIQQDEALDLRQKGEIIALEQIINIARERHPGARLLAVELEEDDGIYIYEVELVTRNGVVRELEVDARTGRILEDEEDD